MSPIPKAAFRKWTVAGALLMGLTAAVLWAAPEKLTAAQWRGLSKQRKIYFIEASMESFPDKRIRFGSVNDMIGLLDQKASFVGRSLDMQAVFKEVVYESQKD